MKRIACLACVAATVGFFPGASAQAIELVQNGGFEDPQIRMNSVDLITDIPGWQIDPASQSSLFEIQNNVAGSPFKGNQFIEMDSGGVTKIFQDLTTEVGKTYKLSFAFSARPGVEDNQLDVWWGESPISSLSANGREISNTSWNIYSYLLQATSTTTRLSFGNLNETRDTVGSYLDDVSVTAVSNATPVPTPAPLLGLIGFGVAALRKKGKKKELVAQEA